jgi:hypothetical protein
MTTNSDVEPEPGSRRVDLSEVRKGLSSVDIPPIIPVDQLGGDPESGAFGVSPLQTAAYPLDLPDDFDG